jgi:hypothetical protein
MVTWSQFYPYILPSVPGAVLPTVDFQLRQAAREWCDRTMCWRDWLDPIYTNGVDRVYDFEVSSGQDVVQLVNATVDSKAADILRLGDLPRDWMTSSCVPCGVVALSSGSRFGVLPLQAEGIAVQTEVTLRPSNTATGVEDELFASYAREIALGALGNLMPGSKFAKDFKDAIDEAALDVFHSFSSAPARVRASFL